MRGGDKFWDFRTFNPPISKNNWANEYAEIAETRADTLVVRNTYLDVPVDWLGQQFFEEAEELKKINPQAYEHEYLGIATGTGGDVFKNACDLDMEQLVPIVDYYGNTLKQVPMWQTFDRIYNGMDWGYARDDTRFVRMHFDKKYLDLYIFAEYSTVKARSEEIYNEIYNVRKLVKNDELVTADSGGGGTFAIADFKAFGAFIRPAEKGADSIRYGIKWLQGLRHIYIDKRRCPYTYKEFVNYEYEQDRDGNFISAYPDYDNHCLTGDTVVNTPNGDYKIEDLVDTSGKIYAYDIDKQRKVIADYVSCRCTFERAEIWRVTLEDNTVIECTFDHPILTANRGYVKACELSENDDVIKL
jgi:phage terminase large subunit